jgi:hypothetical protein
MIPPRMLSHENELFGTGNGLKNRVTACRKRIRLSRFHRTQVNTQPGERLLESTNGAAEFRGYSNDKPAVTGPLSHAPVSELTQPVAEQEVGIT